MGSTGDTSLVWVPAVQDPREDPLPEEFWSIRSRVIDLLGLAELEEDRYKGSFLSYIAPGGRIHRHRDARLHIDGEERLILRCNVLFTSTQHGGLPILEGTELDVGDRGMWAFFPTELFHASTPVVGREFRGLLSFGFLVRPVDLCRRRFCAAPSFRRDYGLDSGLMSLRELLDHLRGGAVAQRISEAQLRVLELVVMSSVDFSAEDVAEATRQPPLEALAELQVLQRAGVIVSSSSASATRGRVVVL